MSSPPDDGKGRPLATIAFPGHGGDWPRLLGAEPGAQFCRFEQCPGSVSIGAIVTPDVVLGALVIGVPARYCRALSRGWIRKPGVSGHKGEEL
jgi:hypothetical protein